MALARALAPQPKVLLLDEPLSALDLKLRKAMQLELKHLQREIGITFISVTHDQEEALTESESLKGTVVDNIFIGTDIATLINLNDGPKFTVRTSNSDRGTKRIFEPGNDVFVNMEAGSARLLVD